MSKINIPVIIRVKNALLEWIDFFFILIFGKLSLMFITEKTEIQKKFQTQSKNIKQFVKNFAHILKCIYWNQKNGFFLSFHERQLKISMTVWSQGVQFFRTSSACVLVQEI